MLALDEVLQRLEGIAARKAKVAELRLFAGLAIDEVADALDVSKRTVEADWSFARAWLQAELAKECAFSGRRRRRRRRLRP